MQFSRPHQRVTHPLREIGLAVTQREPFLFLPLGTFAVPGRDFGLRRASRRHGLNSDTRFLILWSLLFPWWLMTGENSGEQPLHHLFQTLSVKNMLPGDYITTSLCRALHSLRSTFIYYFSTLANALQLWLPREDFWHPVPMVFHDRILI